MEWLDPVVRRLVGACCALAGPLVGWSAIGGAAWRGKVGVALALAGTALVAGRPGSYRGALTMLVAALACVALSLAILWVASLAAGRLGDIH